MLDIAIFCSTMYHFILSIYYTQCFISKVKSTGGDVYNNNNVRDMKFVSSSGRVTELNDSL